MKKYSTEEIEKYLEGQMSIEDTQAMEQAIANNQDLKEEVELQKKLIKSLGMMAFMGAMQQAHARNVTTIQSPVEPSIPTQGLTAKGGFSIFKIIVIGLVGISALVGIVKLIQSKKESISRKNELLSGDSKNDDTTITEKETLIYPNGRTEFAQSVQYNVYTINPTEETIVNDPRSGAKIVIPANALRNRRTGTLVTEPVEVKYREFRDMADIAFSGIRMGYQDGHLKTAGMFELRAFDGLDTLDVIDGKEVKIDFNMTHNGDGIGFYALNEQNTEWTLKENVSNTRSKEQNIEKTDVNDLDFFKSFNKFSNGETKDLTKGTHIIILSGMNCGRCIQTNKDLEELRKLKTTLPEVYLLGSGSEFDKQSFLKETATTAPYIVTQNYIKYKDYHSPLIVVENGQIKKIWDYNTYSKKGLFDYFGVEMPIALNSKLQILNSGLFLDDAEPFIQSIKSQKTIGNIPTSKIEEALKYQELKSGGIEDMKQNLQKAKAFSIENSVPNTGKGTNLTSSNNQLKVLVAPLEESKQKKNKRNTRKTSGTKLAPRTTSFAIKISNGIEAYYVADDNNPAIFSELEPLSGWTFNTGSLNVLKLENETVQKTFKDFKESNPFSGYKTFNDIRILKSEANNEAYSIALTSDGKTDTIRATIVLKGKNKIEGDANQQFLQYEQRRKLRTVASDKDILSKMAAIKSLEDEIKSNENFVEDRLKAGDEELYQITRMIMTDKELAMSKEDWDTYASNNPEIKERIQMHLEKANASPNKVMYLDDLRDNMLTKEQEINSEKKIKNLAQLAKKTSLGTLPITSYDEIKILLTKQELILPSTQWIEQTKEVKTKEQYAKQALVLSGITDNYTQAYEQLVMNHNEIVLEINALKQEEARKDQQIYYAKQQKLTQSFELANFGVYNCDQVRRLSNVVTFATNLNIDQNAYTSVYLVDPSTQSILSFSANNISCNSKSNHSLIAIDRKGKVFIYDQKKWSESPIKEAGTYDIEMEEITADIKTAADLNRFL